MGKRYQAPINRCRRPAISRGETWLVAYAADGEVQMAKVTVPLEACDDMSQARCAIARQLGLPQEAELELEPVR